MNRLNDIGFIKIGKWKFEEDGLRYELFQNCDEKNVLYSFISNDQVKYIGKTVKKINQRLDGYKNPTTSQRTNYRVRKKIIDCLRKAMDVDIYIFNDSARLKYRDLRINLAAGLEDELISQFCPEWNITGKTKVILKKEKMRTLAKKENQLDEQDSFIVNIGKAYYNDGFFNIRVRYSEIFGQHLSPIKIQLGENHQDIIEGYVNRTANNNGTPRIMAGKRYKYWIQENFKKGDIFIVKILNSDFIKIFK